MASNAAKNAAQSYLDVDKKKNDQANGNDQQPDDPTPTKEKKISTSFFVTPSTYKAVKRLAGYRGISIGSLMDKALGEFVEAHADELEEWDNLTAQLRSKYKKSK